MFKVGHRWDRCGHNSDAEQKSLFLRILGVDCDKIWHRLPLVIELQHGEIKNELPWFQMAKNEIMIAEIAKSRDFRSATASAKTFSYEIFFIHMTLKNETSEKKSPICSQSRFE